jgi:hypothetical protein
VLPRPTPHPLDLITILCNTPVLIIVKDAAGRVISQKYGLLGEQFADLLPPGTPSNQDDQYAQG